jgi:hypothetical protein
MKGIFKTRSWHRLALAKSERLRGLMKVRKHALNIKGANGIDDKRAGHLKTLKPANGGRETGSALRA